MNGSLGIVDFRNIINAINNKYRIDFSDYALTSLKRRIERVLRINGFNNPEELIEKLNSESDFLDIFLHDISVEETEMFRDPFLWKYIKDELFQKIISETGTKIWMPMVTSGEELFTLLIVLKEENMLHDIKVQATSNSVKILDDIKTGFLDLKKMEVNIANYRRYKGRGQLEEYYQVFENRAQFDVSLLGNVEFVKHNLNTDKAPSRIKMILFRNQLIYFNQVLHSRTVNMLYESLLPGGYLVIGAKETLDLTGSDRRFVLINKQENVFKKSSIQS